MFIVAIGKIELHTHFFQIWINYLTLVQFTLLEFSLRSLFKSKYKTVSVQKQEINIQDLPINFCFLGMSTVTVHILELSNL